MFSTCFFEPSFHSRPVPQFAEVEQVAVGPPHTSDPHFTPVGHCASLLQGFPRVLDNCTVQIRPTQLSVIKMESSARMFPSRHSSTMIGLTAGRTITRGRARCTCSPTNTRSAYFVRVVARFTILSSAALSIPFQGSTCASLASETFGTLRVHYTCGPFSSTDAVGRK